MIRNDDFLASMLPENTLEIMFKGQQLRIGHMPNIDSDHVK